MDKKEAKKEIYDFLVNNLKVNKKLVVVNNESNLLYLKTKNNIMALCFHFSEYTIEYGLVTNFSTQFKVNYKEDIKLNLSKMVEALKILEEIN